MHSIGDLTGGTVSPQRPDPIPRSNTVALVPSKPDAEVAAELREELIAAAQPYLAATQKAKALGFDVQANFGFSALGKMEIQALNLFKRY